MANLDWCKKQKRGIEIVEPNENLAKDYLESAEETLNLMRVIDGKSNMWLATTKYYFEYFCIYSILIRVGIKCEIHDCTLLVCEFLEENDIVPGYFSKMLSEDKYRRIENQYYLKNKKVNIDYEKMSKMLLETKEIINKLNAQEIASLRENI